MHHSVRRLLFFTPPPISSPPSVGVIKAVWAKEEEGKPLETHKSIAFR